MLVDLLESLAKVQAGLGLNFEALAKYERIKGILFAQHGGTENHPDIARVYNSMGIIYATNLQNYVQALFCHERSVERTDRQTRQYRQPDRASRQDGQTGRDRQRETNMQTDNGHVHLTYHHTSTPRHARPTLFFNCCFVICLAARSLVSLSPFRARVRREEEILASLYGPDDPRVANVLFTTTTLQLDAGDEVAALRSSLRAYQIRKAAAAAARAKEREQGLAAASGLDDEEEPPEVFEAKELLYDIAVEDQVGRQAGRQAAPVPFLPPVFFFPSSSALAASPTLAPVSPRSSPLLSSRSHSLSLSLLFSLRSARAATVSLLPARLRRHAALRPALPCPARLCPARAA